MNFRIRENLFVKLTSFFFRNWRYSILLWITLLFFGAVTYLNIIKREGFPPIQFPLSVVNGTYFVDDKDKVDKDLAQPFYEIVKDVDGVSKITTTANNNFFTAVINFDSDVPSIDATNRVVTAIKKSSALPVEAKLDIISIDPAAFLNKFDLLLSVYSVDENVPEAELQQVARYVADELIKDPLITDTEVQPLIETAPNPITGEVESRQTAFSNIGLSQNNDSLKFYKSITIGVDRDKEQIDVLELSKLINEKISNIDLGQFGTNYKIAIGADSAESINTQIDSLQSNLLTGLIAVALVTLILITWRASIVTGLFMITVVAVTIIILYIIGYTLNTITLFGLVLSLGLFVDDATIVVESIDASKSKDKKPLNVVKDAIQKIGSASFAGTFTTVLVFLPLAFLSGILGEFIRLMPITVIIALISSLLLSLTLIPVLSKFALLRHAKISYITRVNPISKLEITLAKIVAEMPRSLKTNRARGNKIMFSMVGMSIAAVVIAIFYAGNLAFNIFPPTKDSDQIGLEITYPEGYTIDQAKDAANIINEVISKETTGLSRRVTYGSFQQPNSRSADTLIELVPFNTRNKKSPVIIEDLQRSIDATVPENVEVRVLQYDVGPPVSEYPLQIQIYDDNYERALELASKVEDYISGLQIDHSSSKSATISSTRSPSVQSVTRRDYKRFLTVQGSFDADDTSALLAASEQKIRNKFNSEYLADNGFSENSLEFDFGQESENADSFASLAYAFPIALLLMYILLASLFRSLLQPILIFMAIPFTLLGVFAGLYYSNNALSFFVQVGLIGLIGIAVNNTILLTEYANQEKRSGVGTIDAISNAVNKRFRPLITTTLTTVVALLPLALSDPFWEALAFTIIFGLISSTFFVIISFPYYYLAAEWLRMSVSKGTRLKRKSSLN